MSSTAASLPTPIPSSISWRCRHTWRRAARNTFGCLIGCSVGDFSMMFYLQVTHPEMSIFVIMACAMTAGLVTSVALETVLLRMREGFAWMQSMRTAVSMSFMSMLAMELAENVTDYAITGGRVEPGTALFWLALGAALIAGFLVPLPYNYYKLKKYGQACH